jgi:hypothetical protein
MWRRNLNSTVELKFINCHDPGSSFSGEALRDSSQPQYFGDEFGVVAAGVAEISRFNPKCSAPASKVECQSAMQRSLIPWS